MLHELAYYPQGVRESYKNGDAENAGRRSRIVADNNRKVVPYRVFPYFNPEPERGGTPHGKSVRINVPRLPFVRMLDKQGNVRELVVYSTTDLECQDLQAISKAIGEKQRAGWLLLEVCPLRGNHVAPNGDNDKPCSGRHVNGCPHVIAHARSRRRNARAENEAKQKQRIQRELDKMRAQGDAIGTAIKEGISQVANAPKSENEQLKAQVAQLTQLVEKLASEVDKKPRKRRRKIPDDKG